MPKFDASSPATLGEDLATAEERRVQARRVQDERQGLRGVVLMPQSEGGATAPQRVEHLVRRQDVVSGSGVLVMSNTPNARTS